MKAKHFEFHASKLLWCEGETVLITGKLGDTGIRV